ncbi:hypothetical protein [Ectothiorhodospira lacustris]|uniref:hypothetical protein n=1 Tax=Ectothiorhodospira lacustris TaxID=2899127 RepID=UPI001EE790C4|nr:hypothetical protein [Ectothiorhodospira lacustris]MCG5509625.1 hypothetical protein [Ectothiorhodospira lacustris]MCG5521580.1 hypothetical protein [Ectothiorhodospira lacustris]
MKRLPPFGRQITQARQGNLPGYWGTSPDGRHPSLWCVVGSRAWDAARAAWNPPQPRSPRLVTACPPGEDPADMDWQCLAGADPVLLVRAGDVDGDQVHGLVVAMLTAGVGRILDMGTGNRYMSREADHAA